MSLRKGLRASSEDELLQMQAEFAASGRSPSAKVASIDSRSTAEQPVQPPVKALEHAEAPSNPSTGASVADVFESEKSEGWQIVGNVCERQPKACSAPQLAPATFPSAFPRATHRKASKFALSRQAKGREAKPASISSEAFTPSNQPSAQPRIQPTNKGDSSNSQDAAETVQPGGSGRSQKPALEPGTAGMTGRQNTESQMAQEVAAENKKLIASMQPDEVETAKQEIRERLDPNVLAFLQKRAAERLAQQKPSGDSTGGVLKCAAQRPAQQKPSKDSTGDVLDGTHARSEQPSSEGPTTETGRLRASQSAAKVQQDLTQSTLPSHSASSGAAGDSIVGRMRFDTEGKLVEIHHQTADPAPVTERDLLRQDEGALSGGYTVTEMCQLARSSLPAQRAFACRHLAAILTQTQQGLSCGPQTSASKIPEAGKVTWLDLWRHTTQDCEAALVLRFALDDSAPGVISSAAAALHALLGSSHGSVELDFLDPELPAVPLRRLERPHPSAAWTSLYPVQEEDLSFPQNTAEVLEGDSNATDPHQLAKHDSMAAMLHMQVLDRIRYLLTSAAAPAALEPILALLGDLALGGADVAHAICDTSGLVAGLMAVLDLRSAVSGSQAAARAEAAARPAALRVLCLLCQSGVLISRRLLFEGIESRVLRFVLSPAMQLHSSYPADHLALRLQVIALRIWRVLAAVGLSSLPLDDAYAAICRHLEPSLDHMIRPSAQGQSSLELTAAAESLRLCWTILQHAAASGQSAGVSEGCTAAIMKAAASWLQDSALTCIDRALHGSTSGQPSLDGSTPALLSAFGAALNLVALEEVNTDQALTALVDRIADIKSGSRCSLIASLLQLLRGSCWKLYHADGPTDAVQGDPQVFLAGSAALRACLDAMKGSSQEQAGSLASEVVTALTKGANFGDESLQADMCLEPWEASHLDIAQSKALTLLTALELLQSLCKNDSHAGKAAAAYLEGHAKGLRDALMWTLTVLPPGSEDLALRALSCLLHHTLMSRLHSMAEQNLKAFLTGDSTLAKAALRHAAWWQMDSEMAEPVPPLSSKDLRQSLLHAYAAHWLGLVPEDKQSAAPASAPVLHRSFFRQPIGSRLPVPRDWPFHAGWEVDLQTEPRSELVSIPEEGTSNSAKASNAAACLLFLLGLDIDGCSFIDNLPIGTRIGRVLDLLFGPATDSSAPDTSSRPWTDPVVRQAAALLLELGLRQLFSGREGAEASLKVITEADVGRWALEFATVSFGDPLLASAIAILLLPQMPEGVQVIVLDVLDQEAACHLLPSLSKAPSYGCKENGQPQALFTGAEPPAEVVRMYKHLADKGSLKRAAELGSLPHCIATTWRV